MIMTNEFKLRVVQAIKEDAPKYRSASKHAVALGINGAQLSRIKKGDTHQVLADGKWISIARKLEVEMNPGIKWNTARTPAFDFIYSQLSNCQSWSISAVLCDMPDLGKTHTAKVYVRENINAIYIDCSQVKHKQTFLRKIAKEFGVEYNGRYQDVYEDLTYYLRSLPNPLIILDEAGDLRAEAFLELKALWNATERSCGWYMMGADGLKARFERQRALKKVGYAELFRRYGSKYQKVSPDGGSALDHFKKEQFSYVAKANGFKDIQRLYVKSNGSLERIRIEFEKKQMEGEQGELKLEAQSA